MTKMECTDGKCEGFVNVSGTKSTQRLMNMSISFLATFYTSNVTPFAVICSINMHCAVRQPLHTCLSGSRCVKVQLTHRGNNTVG